MQNGLINYWPPADVETLKILRARGLTITAIAAEMQCTPERVRDKINRLRKAERKAERKGDRTELRKAKRAEIEARNARIAEKLKKGMTLAEISRELSIPRATIQWALTKGHTKDQIVAAPISSEWERLGISRERYLAGHTPLPAMHPLALEILNRTARQSLTG